MKFLPISEYQQRFFLEWALAPEDSTYNVSVNFKIKGKPDVAKLIQACGVFIKKNEICHARYNDDGSKCFYEDYSIEDIFQEKTLDIHKDINLQLREFLDEPFDLTHDILLRFILLKNSKAIDEYYFLALSHHMIADAYFAINFVEEISKNYNLLVDHLKDPIHIPKTFSQAVESEQQMLTLEYKQKAREYWLNFIADFPLNIKLPYKPEIKQQDLNSQYANKKGEFVYFELDEHDTRQLKNYAKKNKTTLFIVISAIYGLIVSKYSNQSKLLLSYPINMRSKEYMEIVGCFVNNLPLKLDLEQNETFDKLIASLTLQRREVKDFRGYSMTHMIEDQRKYNHVGASDFFNVGFAAANLGVVSLELDALNVTSIDIPSSNNSIYELDLQYDIGNTSITKFKLGYRAELFDKSLIESFIGSFKTLISKIINQDSINCNTYCVLDSNAYNQVMYQYNQTMKPYAQDKTIHQLFEEQVAKTPDNIAVVYEDKNLTYQELNERANQLANYLRNVYAIQGNDLIALCLNRSEYMLLAILGILKAGGAYVPMDPGYPEDRINYILSDTKAKILITTSHCEWPSGGTIYCHSHVDGNPCPMILTIDDNKFLDILKTYPKSNPKLNITSDSLAYVIYTSGTTGMPKGVMLQHQGIINRIQWMNDEYPLTEQDKILQKTPYVFDVSVWELFWANWYGATIVFVKPDGHKDSDYLIKLIAQEEISIVHFVPSMIGAFIQTLESLSPDDMDKLSKLRYIFCSGESLPLTYVKTVRKLLPSMQIYNLYGPTETSVDVLYYDCNAENITKVCIGKPISNTTAYILDNNLNPLPFGSVGELYIGGVGLAMGYLNQPELTAKRFIMLGNDRIYKTGDLVRMLPDGNIEYMGRNDFQVKIRGFRIELGEIESQLTKYPEIKQAVVLALEHQGSNDGTNGNKYLAAYYVAETKLDDASILNYLSKELPYYMMPAILVHLKKLPLTINGKLDRKALPDPEFADKNTFIEPRTELELQLCAIYAEVLNLEINDIGVKDSFFRLGGDSILAIRLVSKINKKFNSRVTVKDIFKLNDIVRLTTAISPNIKAMDDINYKKFSLIDIEKYKNIIESGTIEDIYPASYLQTGMLLESALQSYGTYHDVFSYQINYEFNEDKFNGIWNQLIMKHELLRAKFVLADEGWLVCITNHLVRRCQIIDGELDLIIENERLNPFNFKEAGLFRLFINKQGNIFNFIFSFHHAIADGWSIASIVNEFIQAYVNNKEVIVAPLVYYGEFIYNEQIALQDNNQINFWKSYLIDMELSNIKWKFNNIPPNNKGLFIKQSTLEAGYVAKLHALVKQESISTDSIFIWAYMATISQFMNKSDICIGLVVNNRLEKEDGDKLFGLFLNTIPYRLQVNNDLNLSTIFNEKIKLYAYKQIPYGYIKTLFGFDIYDFAFNFTHFHTLAKSKNEIIGINIFERTNIPFLMNVLQQGSESIDISLIVHDDFIDQEYLHYFSDYLIHNLKLILDENYHNCLVAEDYIKIIYDWNKIEKVCLQDKTIHQLFEEQAIRTPDNLAVIYEDKKLTYQELNKSANQLANYLREVYQIKGDDLVALCLHRNMYMVVAILGVLKAGGAYVPIDPDSPEDRINYILDDTKTKVVITDFKTRQDFKISGNPCLGVINVCDVEFTHTLKKYSNVNPKSNTTSTNLAYVLYTSGTTGKPKGVMVEHISCSIRIIAMVEKSNINVGNRCLFKTSYLFDVSFSDIFTALISGAKLYVTRQVFNIAEICELIEKYDIDICHFVPSQLNTMLGFNDLSITRSLNKLKTINVSGESFDKSVVIKTPGIRYVNYYGPTETGEVTADIADARSMQSSSLNLVTIGGPIYETKLYILSTNLNLLPIGVIGELYISGASLARGYLNLPELTAERFIANPFQTDVERKINKYERLYKTGDLARYLPDGNIEYIGRNDFQIKIRGFRVELGEIESRLASYTGIKQAVVIPHGYVNQEGVVAAESKYLVGYYVAEDKLDKVAILNYLTESLPEYMVPSALVLMDSLPLTMNGKLDRSALPDPQMTDTDNYVAPSNYMEQQICKIYAEILSLAVDKVGAENNFFHLGGNSILVIKLVRKIDFLLDKEIDFSMIYKYPTARMLAKYLKQFDNHGLVNLINSRSDYKKPMLVLCHTARGSAEIYFDFANLLTDYFDVYVISSYNLSKFENKNYYTNFDQLIEHYKEELNKYLPKYSKYIVCGWSFGGIIANGIVNLFSKTQRDKSSLLLLDTYTPELLSKFVADINLGDHMDSLYSSAPQKEVGKIHDAMYQSYAPNISPVSCHIIKAAYADGFISDEQIIKAMNEEKYNGWEKYHQKIYYHFIEATHETLLDHNNLPKLANYFIHNYLETKNTDSYE